MRVLYVTGNNLQYNNSANMSHNAYVEGLLDNGCDVDIIMSEIGFLPKDDSMPRFESANYFEFSPNSLLDRAVEHTKTVMRKNKTVGNTEQSVVSSDSSPSIRKSRISLLRNAYYDLRNRIWGDYGRHIIWVRNASHFYSEKEYDIVVSNSSPSASHLLVDRLIKQKRIRAKKWIQIWEDPWYYDLYTQKRKSILEEEARIVSLADRVVYVSPITCRYQQKYFKHAADKMAFYPLPSFNIDADQDNGNGKRDSIGYFGDYYSFARDIIPFYNAVKSARVQAYIYGNSDVALQQTNQIDVSKRVGIEELKAVMQKTDILVNLCNIHGGQIPGKIYHYSVTTKPILFILDGTEEEKVMIREAFTKYNRYCFCDNNEADIERAIRYLQNEGREYEPVCNFDAKNIVAEILASIR